MISVAMTTYNGGLYVKKQLKSILEQTLLPDEVIIVDDCSTDNTLEIVEKFILQNNLTSWKLIRSIENRGYIKAFNSAIKKTRGDIIFLCDHDDIWLPNKIEIMSKVMLKNPDILSLASSFKKIDANDEEIISKNNPFSSNNNLIRKRIKNGTCNRIDLNMVINYNISPGCTSAFRSILKKSLREFEETEYNLVHDWKINIIAAAMEGLYFLNIPTIKYRLHSTNAIGLKRKYSINSRITSYQKFNAEKKFMRNIINKLINLKIISNENNLKKVIRQIDDIESSLIARIEALKKCSLCKYLLMLFRYKCFRTRMIESWFVDIYIILRKKITS